MKAVGLASWPKFSAKLRAVQAGQIDFAWQVAANQTTLATMEAGIQLLAP